MANLQRVLDLAGYVDADHFVMERLAEMAPDDPVRAVDILGKLVRGDKRGWGVDNWGGSAEKVLRVGLQDARTTSNAMNVIHELGARGYFQFRGMYEDPEKTREQ